MLGWYLAVINPHIWLHHEDVRSAVLRKTQYDQDGNVMCVMQPVSYTHLLLTRHLERLLLSLYPRAGPVWNIISHIHNSPKKHIAEHLRYFFSNRNHMFSQSISDKLLLHFCEENWEVTIYVLYIFSMTELILIINVN